MAILHIKQNKEGNSKEQYKEKVQNILLKPLYNKVEEIKEDIMLKDKTAYPESITVSSASLSINGDYLNPSSSSEKKEAVKKFIQYMNDGSLEKHLSEPEVKTTIDLLYKTNTYFKNDMPEKDYIKCLCRTSELHPETTLKEEDACYHILPNYSFKYITPEHIAIVNETPNKEIKSIVVADYNKTIEKELLEPASMMLFFSVIYPDWVHSGNDKIEYIESSKYCGFLPRLSEAGQQKFYKANDADDEEAIMKQTDEESVFHEWLREPKTNKITSTYPYKDHIALNNCFQSIKNRLGWQFENVKPEYIQNALATLWYRERQKNNVQLKIKDFGTICYNDKPLKLHLINENEAEFLTENMSVLTIDIKGYFLNEHDKTKTEEAKNNITLNNVTIDTSRFCKEVYFQSIRYKWNSYSKKKENEHIDIMLSKNMTLKDAVRTALHFMQQYVKPDKTLELAKTQSSFDYNTDCYDDWDNNDKGTLTELFSRMTEKSNLRDTIENIGRLIINCKDKTLRLEFWEYNEGYNRPKTFKFKSDKEVFPNLNIEIRDKYQCVLDKKDRERIQNRNGRRW